MSQNKSVEELRDEFAIKYHRGDFLVGREKFDNSELISDWWIAQFQQERQTSQEREREIVEAIEKLSTRKEYSEHLGEDVPFVRKQSVLAIITNPNKD